MVEASLLTEATAQPEHTGVDVREPPLRLLALTVKPPGLSPGQRFRLEQWAPYLAAGHNICVDFLPFESPALTQLLYRRGHTLKKAGWVLFDFLRRMRAVVRARSYDAVVIYREAALIGPGIYERLLAWTGVPLFFDFDDAIWSEEGSKSVNGVFARLHFWGKTATICRLADGVIAGNNYLADYARTRDGNVFVVPTTVDLASYPMLPEAGPDEPFVVSWTGSHSTLAHFENARPALEKLARMKKIAVKIICNAPPSKPIAGAENRFVQWSPEREAEEIGDCHVGIMPLPDTEFTRGKCGLKALQFMATGRPVIISPVGMNRDLVDHGENGFLAATDDEWLEALLLLADAREVRATVGQAGRKTIEENYSARVAAAKFNDAVRATLLSRSARPNSRD
jgi:glycosyltransferase involved in cell wall biosynthesis